MMSSANGPGRPSGWGPPSAPMSMAKRTFSNPKTGESFLDTFGVETDFSQAGRAFDAKVRIGTFPSLTEARRPSANGRCRPDLGRSPPSGGPVDAGRSMDERRVHRPGVSWPGVDAGRLRLDVSGLGVGRTLDSPISP